MTSLSKKKAEKKGPSSEDVSTEEWVAWDIRSFDKIETESFKASEKRGVDLNASFQPLYERREMTIDDQFVLMYKNEKGASDLVNAFKEEFSQTLPDNLEGEIKKEKHAAKVSLPREEKKPENNPDMSAPEPDLEKKSADPEITIDTEEIKKAAYEEGFQKGVSDGFQRGLEEAAGPVLSIKALLLEMDGLWHRMIRTNEEKILKLIGLIVDKIVYGHVALDGDVVKKSVLDAFYLLTEPDTAMIYVNNDDYDHIDAVKDDFFKEIKALKQISVISDPAVSRGGCRIESESGEVDATLESRLEAVKKSIFHASLKTDG